MHVHSSAFSTDQRIVIAVTKYDQRYSGTDPDHELEVSQVRELVKEGLEETGITVPLDYIVPVSGQWALAARRLKANIQDRSLSRQARLYHHVFQNSQSTDDTQNMDDTQNIDDEMVAGVLEDISSIVELEQR